MPAQVTYRDCVGHLGYRVGSDGSVWSSWVCGGKSKTPNGPWYQLTCSRTPSGHCTVNFKGKILRVHRLVLEAFVGPCPDGMECRHFPDRDPTNNNLSNLSWGTRQQNVDDKRLQGTHQYGTLRYNAKLNDDLVRQMRIDALKDPSFGVYKRASKKYKVDTATCRKIILRRSWKHVL